jgi:hypothetical protein
MRNYIIVEADNNAELIIKVNDHINMGYLPIGSVYTYDLQDHFCQPMILKELKI